jgi:hypothetical protein
MFYCLVIPFLIYLLYSETIPFQPSDIIPSGLFLEVLQLFPPPLHSLKHFFFRHKFQDCLADAAGGFSLSTR